MNYTSVLFTEKLEKRTLPEALREWENILNSYSFEDVLILLKEDSENAKRLRSSSPFTWILTEEERIKIFIKYKIEAYNN